MQGEGIPELGPSSTAQSLKAIQKQSPSVSRLIDLLLWVMDENVMLTLVASSPELQDQSSLGQWCLWPQTSSHFSYKIPISDLLEHT
jgi:hypothetical protein